MALDPVCAMSAHPETRQIGPGACRRCGMALEPAAGVLSAFTAAQSDDRRRGDEGKLRIGGDERAGVQPASDAPRTPGCGDFI